jgi:hypothetical protein
MSYSFESESLDREILEVIDAWHRRGEELSDQGFNDLALRLFAYQLRYNQPYARYCEHLGVTLSSLPSSWEQIPAVPAPGFKEAALCTFDPEAAALHFETSGTTNGKPGHHYLETPSLYGAALLAGFDRFMLADGMHLRYFNLVPSPLDAPRSSLGYMMMRVAQHRGDGKSGWYLHQDGLHFNALQDDLRSAVAEERPICLATTAFALVRLVDEMEACRIVVTLPRGSRIMETGGFKGRSRIVSREQLYVRACDRFGIEPEAIIAEYGMTELSSQYYDLLPDDGPLSDRRKVSAPWLRARVVGPDRKTLPNGETGSILHVDLANRSSCIAIQTEDLGVQYDDGLVLVGRAGDAEPRGCSLTAEELTGPIRYPPAQSTAPGAENVRVSTSMGSL